MSLSRHTTVILGARGDQSARSLREQVQDLVSAVCADAAHPDLLRAIEEALRDAALRAADLATAVARAYDLADEARLVLAAAAGALEAGWLAGRAGLGGESAVSRRFGAEGADIVSEALAIAALRLVAGAPVPSERRGSLVARLADAMGAGGLVGARWLQQVAERDGEGVYRRDGGALFALAASLPAAAAGEEDDVHQLRQAGQAWGVAWQLARHGGARGEIAGLLDEGDAVARQVLGVKLPPVQAWSAELRAAIADDWPE